MNILRLFNRWLRDVLRFGFSGVGLRAAFADVLLAEARRDLTSVARIMNWLDNRVDPSLQKLLFSDHRLRGFQVVCEPADRSFGQPNQ